MTKVVLQLKSNPMRLLCSALLLIFGGEWAYAACADPFSRLLNQVQVKNLVSSGDYFRQTGGKVCGLAAGLNAAQMVRKVLGLNLLSGRDANREETHLLKEAGIDIHLAGLNETHLMSLLDRLFSDVRGYTVKARAAYSSGTNLRDRRYEFGSLSPSDIDLTPGTLKIVSVGPFGRGSHFVVLTANKNGRIEIQDPYRPDQTLTADFVRMNEDYSRAVPELRLNGQIAGGFYGTVVVKSVVTIGFDIPN